MVWPFTSSDDPLKKLDPELRKFLEKEAPKSQPPPRTQRPAPQNAPSRQDPVTLEALAVDEQPKVPQQSLYQDGRYAHLWKTYKTGATVDAKSDSEILKDLTSSYKWRKNEIGKVALENCSFEAMAESDCWKSGSFTSKLWMCRAETKALDRCTNLQTKFLLALGYLSLPDRSQDVEDRIQMHADHLYQQMLQHEQAVKTAKEKGLPVPVFKPVMSRENLAKVLGVSSPETLQVADQAQVLAANTELSHVPEEMRIKYEQTVKDMSPEERLIEEAAHVGKARDTSALAKEYQDLLEKRKQDREIRRTEGRETIGDRVTRWWGKE